MHCSLNSETCRNQLGFSFHTVQQLYWPRDASAATTATTAFVLSSVFLVWQPIWLDWKNRQLKTVHDTSCWTSFFFVFGHIWVRCLRTLCNFPTPRRTPTPDAFLTRSTSSRQERNDSCGCLACRWTIQSGGTQDSVWRSFGFATMDFLQFGDTYLLVLSCSYFMRLGFWRGFGGILVGCPKILLHTYLDGYTTRKYTTNCATHRGKRSSEIFFFHHRNLTVSHSLSEARCWSGGPLGQRRGGQGSTIWSIQMTRNPIHRPCPARAARNHVSSYISKC